MNILASLSNLLLDRKLSGSDSNTYIHHHNFCSFHFSVTKFPLQG